MSEQISYIFPEYMLPMNITAQMYFSLIFSFILTNLHYEVLLLPIKIYHIHRVFRIICSSNSCSISNEFLKFSTVIEDLEVA